MQYREFPQQNTVKPSDYQDANLIESPSTSAPITEAPINGDTISNGGLILVPIFLLVLAWILACIERFNFQKRFDSKFTTLKHYHQIPCQKCCFFNQNFYLKCAVHPSEVLSKEAINCPDYCCKDSNNHSDNSHL